MEERTWVGSETDRRAAVVAHLPRTGAGALLWVGTAAVAVAVAVATARTLHGGWEPVGDEAVVAGLAKIMISGDPTPVGMPTSFWQYTGTESYHPGPLLFAWLAPWVAVFGRDLGAGLGSAVLNLAAVVSCGWGVRRIAGDRAAVGFLLAAGLAAAVVTDRGLVRPLNSMLSALPLLAVLVLAWVAVCGVRWALPMMIFWASFVVQSHVAYAFVAVAVAVPAAVIHFRDRPRGVRRRDMAMSGLLFLVLWSGPLIDAAWNRGGNLFELARAAFAGDVPSRGWGAAGRFVTGLLSLPPGGVSPEDVFDTPARIWNLLLAAPILLLVGWTLRRGGRTERRALAMLAVAVGAGAVTAASLPPSPVIRPQVLWFPVIAMFTWSVLAVCALRWLEWHGPFRWASRTLAQASMYSLCFVVVLLAQPVRADARLHTEQFLQRFLDGASAPVADVMPPDERHLIVANRSVDADRVVQTFIADRVASGHPIAVQATNYWGEERGLSPEEPPDGVVVVTDRPARAGHHLTEVVAEDGPTSRERAAVTSDIAEFVNRAGPLVLTDEGSRYLAEALDGRLPGDCEDLGRYRDRPERIVTDAPGALIELYQHGRVASPDLPADLARRMWELQRPGLWVYAFDGALLDVQRSSPEHLVLSRLGCKGVAAGSED